MGIDVYLGWNGQSKDEEQAQCTGFRIDAGNVGYLREAYHGGPYATRVLAPEAFEDGVRGGVPIAASVLRSRLAATIETARDRSLRVYKEPLEAEAEKAFVDFVELAERKERETGVPCRVTASW